MPNTVMPDDLQNKFRDELEQAFKDQSHVMLITIKDGGGAGLITSLSNSQQKLALVAMLTQIPDSEVHIDSEEDQS